MNLQQAEIQAKILTNVRKVDHVIVKGNDEYFVEIANLHKGSYAKIVKYVAKKKEKKSSKNTQ